MRIDSGIDIVSTDIDIECSRMSYLSASDERSCRSAVHVSWHGQCMLA